ncbi:MAG: FAD-dependent monooxygenase [Alphaproteobacteria bacterium]|nr:FAD-dependent monooxygenase [Alphaproteobacteria bacterium]
MTDFTTIVSGAGPAGLAAAILLAQDGVKTAVIAPASTQADPRTVALMQPSIRLLKFAKLWTPEIECVSAPLQTLQIMDDTGHYVTAPTVSFSSDEVKLDCFGYNVPLTQLIPAMRQRALDLGIPIIDTKSETSELFSDHILVKTLDGQSLTARVLIAADGAASPLRVACGIGVSSWSYDQSALITVFSHTGPHNNTSTEYHKTAGAFTTVPMPGNRSSLVWMDRPEKCKALFGLSDQELATEIQIETHGRLGRISDLGVRKVFAMKGERANIFAKGRTLLIGEAAHTVPPIGAQGLNMSLRDAAQAADLILGADDPGSDGVMQDYNDMRKVDVVPRQQMISLVNMSLLSEYASFGLLRAAGLAAVAKIPPLRDLAMAQGLAPSSNLPFAMR